MTSFEQLRTLAACERSSVEDRARSLHSRLPCIKEMWEAAAGEVLECVREPHNVQGRYAMTVKNGNIHGTFTTKSVFVLLVTRGHDILYSNWILRRCIELTFVYCAQKLVRVIFVL